MINNILLLLVKRSVFSFRRGAPFFGKSSPLPPAWSYWHWCEPTNDVTISLLLCHIHPRPFILITAVTSSASFPYLSLSLASSAYHAAVKALFCPIHQGSNSISVCNSSIWFDHISYWRLSLTTFAAYKSMVIDLPSWLPLHGMYTKVLNVFLNFALHSSIKS